MSFERARERMVTEQLARRGLRDARVLAAMRRVPRHAFVPSALGEHAYDDSPLPIGKRQTISQPYIVALMTEALALRGGERVLEIGTGSGYQAAVLAELGTDVVTVERLPELADRARATLAALGLADRVRIEVGDGTLGWPEAAPYDAIVVTAAGPEIPRPLLAQLMPGGRLVLPMGEADSQVLVRLRRGDRGWLEDDLGGCRFVRLVGRHGWGEPEG